MSTSLPVACATPVDCQDMLDNVQEMIKEYLRSVCQGCQIALFSISPKSPHPTTFDKVTVATVKSKLMVISGKLGIFGEHYMVGIIHVFGESVKKGNLVFYMYTLAGG